MQSRQLKLRVPSQFLLPSLAETFKCSHEHKANTAKIWTPPNPRSAQTVPATRTQFMAEAEEKLKPIRTILETIRERADYALKQLQDAEEERAMRWRCKDCRYIKHFTRPATLESAGKCPRCKSISFEAVIKAESCFRLPD